MKIEKLITEKDIENEIDNGDLNECLRLSDLYQLQYLKSYNTQDADFEVIEPKHLLLGWKKQRNGDDD